MAWFTILKKYSLDIVCNLSLFPLRGLLFVYYSYLSDIDMIQK